MEKLKYVSPEYQARLNQLAETLVMSRRFGNLALDDTVEFPAVQEPLFDATALLGQ